MHIPKLFFIYFGRCTHHNVLCCLVHREWNDLFDNRGYTFDQLIQAFDYESSIPKELSLLRQLKHLERNYIPSEHAKAFLPSCRPHGLYLFDHRGRIRSARHAVYYLSLRLLIVAGNKDRDPHHRFVRILHVCRNSDHVRSAVGR